MSGHMLRLDKGYGHDLGLDKGSGSELGLDKGYGSELGLDKGFDSELGIGKGSGYELACFNIHRSGVLTKLIGCDMTRATRNCYHFLQVLRAPYNHAPV